MVGKAERRVGVKCVLVDFNGMFGGVRIDEKWIYEVLLLVRVDAKSKGKDVLHDIFSYYVRENGEGACESWNGSKWVQARRKLEQITSCVYVGSCVLKVKNKEKFWN